MDISKTSWATRMAEPLSAVHARLTAVFSRAWYVGMARVPVPSHVKWSALLDLLVHMARAPAHSPPAGHATPDAVTEDPVADALSHAFEHAGGRWAWRRSVWLAHTAVPAEALADVMTVTLKTLNMPSRVTVRGASDVEITTAYCPFIRSMVRGTPLTRQVCDRVCGERHSLFKAAASGMPLPVQYAAPGKMGHGDVRCVKTLRVLRHEG